jgi:hypothetical protein
VQQLGKQLGDFRKRRKRGELGLIHSRCRVMATTRPNWRRTHENPVRRGCTV